MRPLRIAIATNNLFMGGSQQLVATHALAFSARGHQVAVLDLVGGPNRLAGKPEPLREPILAAGIPLIDFHIRSARDLSEWRRALTWFRAWRPDIVHGHLPPADRWSALLGRAVGARTLATKHDTYTDLPPRARRAERLAARWLFDRTLAISEATRGHLIDYIGVPPERIRRVPNPVDTERFDPTRFTRQTVRRRLGLTPEGFWVGYLGRLVARKGLGVWLEAAALAAASHPELRFLVIGDGEDRALLEARAAGLGLAERIHFAGRQVDVPAWLAACDALLFTPLAGEGLPIALLEAMAMGLPIVASNLGANRELLDAVGLLPEPADWRFEADSLAAAPFAAALVQLRQDPQLADRLGSAARRRVLEHFSLDVVIEAQLAVYAELLDAPVRSRSAV
ncbi:MAG: glycosyltransferase family 4 protein [Caldilineae bacterium]|nr:glycosyltransferase family 4 protein [Chloroflexota bacterium]MCB9176140.1 glycosyltransferase family 4 protein [Caldilineae bacterium]